MPLGTTLRRLLGGGTAPEFDAHDYWQERHNAHSDSLQAVGHRRLTDEANAEQYAVKKERLAEVIRRHVPSLNGKTLLDAGCGIGLLTPAYVELGFRVTGVDFCETAIGRARAVCTEADFMVSLLSALALSRSFDVVAVVDVLQHVVRDQEWNATLSALSAHVKPGGLLIILDWFADVPQDPVSHCKPRPLSAYDLALSQRGLERVDHQQFELEHEGATKDLLVARHDHDGQM